MIELIDYEAYDPREYWASGFHKSIGGNIVRIAKMSDDMLKAMIRFFDGQYDTKVFKRQLNKRKK